MPHRQLNPAEQSSSSEQLVNQLVRVSVEARVSPQALGQSKSKNAVCRNRPRLFRMGAPSLRRIMCGKSLSGWPQPPNTSQSDNGRNRQPDEKFFTFAGLRTRCELDDQAVRRIR